LLANYLQFMPKVCPTYTSTITV